MAANLLREYLDTILMEGMNYGDMFTQYLQVCKAIGQDVNAIQQSVNTEVKWAKTALIKNNRIVWYLRWFRLSQAIKLRSWVNEPEKVDLVNKYINSLLAEAAKGGAGQIDINSVPKFGASPQLHNWLQHIFSLPVPAIQSYPLDWKPIELVSDDLRKIEAAWSEQTTRQIPVSADDGVHIALDCGNGYKWVALNKHYCRKEADAMGHCGNQYGHPGDRIFSLRKVIKKSGKTYWEPFLTFIVDKDGMLGESKGRGNEKPADRYHDCIMQFLMSNLVKGIKGGGYDPANNFSTDDLTEEQQDTLFAAKPMMAPISWVYKQHGMTPELATRVIATCASNDIPAIGWSEDYKYFRAYKFDQWTEILEEHGDSSTKNLMKSLEDGLQNWSFDVSRDDAKNLFNDLPSDSYPLIVKRIIAENGEDTVKEWIEDNDMDFDANDSSDVWELCENFFEDFIDHLKNCVQDGYQSGTEAEVQQALIDAVKEGVEIDGHNMFVVFNNPENKVVWDEECWLCLNQDAIMSILSNDELVEEIARNGWFFDSEFKVQEPYYGFSGYDSDYALERVWDEYPDFRPQKVMAKAA